MLKKFFLNFLSSFVGAWVALGLFCLVAVLVVIGLIGKAGMSAASTAESVKKHSVLVLELNGEIDERETPADVDYMSLMQGELNTPQTLTSLISAIREAKDNKDVKMIYLKCGGLSAGTATLHSLREELSKFRESGKKIYAYSDMMGNGDYYISSVADSLFINPEGMVSLTGLTATSMYFKDLLDKVGIQVQIAKVGTYKSAVEPFISNEMSQPARAQLDTLLNNVWGVMLGDMAKSRRLKVPALNKMVSDDYLSLKDGNDAVKLKLADKAVFERTMDQRIADALGVEKEKVNFISPSTLSSMVEAKQALKTGDNIAVLYAVGEIREGTKNGINCEVLVPVITELADDDDVKGMVLRVNSPGGSVFGSEQIAEALAYFQKKGKPLAVSMGDYAASGGYWISCHADRIFADATTITGSIGIYGMFPNASQLADKLGIHIQEVSTNPQASFPGLFKKMDESQMAQVQSYIEKGYERFINRVATGRKMKPSEVRVIAEGRVWDGKKALSLGLVDELGDLDQAIDWVRGKCEKGDKLNITTYPKVESSFWDVVKLSMQSEVNITLIKEAMKLTPDAEMATEVGNILRRKNEQAMMPGYKVTLK
ncbi:MAG: signal peptide peptidase SppA [Muribaculaceae bacterium]|nr:signal peptide peptidase SppA [Muribaculaceae bacterium]